jgi:hypothetical protein
MSPLKRIKDHFYYRTLERDRLINPKTSSSNFLQHIVVLIPYIFLKEFATIKERVDGWVPTDTFPKYIFFNADPKVDHSAFDALFISKKELDWKGVPLKSKIDHILRDRFDMLINLDIKGNRAMEYTCAAINADMKVGLIETKHKLYDLLVDTSADSADGYLNEIENFIRKLIVH